MTKNQARHPGSNTFRQQWKSIRSLAAQERQSNMKQRACEEGTSDKTIEANYCKATAATNQFLYSVRDGSEFRSTVNTEFFYWLVDGVFQVATLGPEVSTLWSLDDHENWKIKKQRASKPWSPEYLEYFTQRVLIDGDGRGTATMEDGTIVKLCYERTAAPQSAKHPQAQGDQQW